jgi:hypothetical protein
MEDCRIHNIIQRAAVPVFCTNDEQNRIQEQVMLPIHKHTKADSVVEESKHETARFGRKY